MAKQRILNSVLARHVCIEAEATTVHSLATKGWATILWRGHSQCKHHDGGPHQLKLVHQLEVELDGEELPFVNQRCTNKVHGNNPIFKDLNANNPCQAAKCKEMTSIFKDKHLQPVERLMARWRPSDR